MKFRIQIKDVTTGELHWERHDNPSVNSKYSAKQAAKHLVDKYNTDNAHRWGKRELVSVELINNEVTS